MKHTIAAAAAMTISATVAQAQDIEQSTQSVAILFEEGRYAEFSFDYLDRDVSGSLLAPVAGFPAGSPSGDMAAGQFSLGFGYKAPLSDQLDLAIIMEQPIGAKVQYPGTFGITVYPMAAASADLTSNAVTALLRYKSDSNVSVYGGLRHQTMQAIVSVPFVGAPGPGYTLKTNNDGALGYVLGVAWEMPDTATRVALTYHSAITHTLDSVEGGPSPAVSTFETEVPQSVTLDFQTGVARDTLLFGSVRWVDSSEFAIDPVGYPLATPLIGGGSDQMTYTLGIDQTFSETWSGAVILSHKPSDGEVRGDLTPTDGGTSIGLSATHTMDRLRITGSVSYERIGDAVTRIGSNFTDNSGFGFGMKIGYTF